MVEPIPSRQKVTRRRRIAVIRLGSSRRKHQWRWRLSFLRRLRQVATYKRLVQQVKLLCNRVITDMIEGPAGDVNMHVTPRMSTVVTNFTTPFMSVPYIKASNYR